MTGSDYIDTLFEAYKQPDRSKEFQHGLVANLLKTAAALHAKAKAGEPTLLSAIICSTDVLYRLEAALAKSDSARGRSLLASLQVYQRECRHLHQVAPFVQRAQKGKKPTTISTNDTRLHLVSEVKELLPDLEDAYVFRLLDHYSDNVEVVVAHLLDNSVPPELQNESGLTAQPIAGSNMAQSQLRDIDDATAAPKGPERRNIFDNDEFDKLAVPSSRVRVGHAKKKTTADDLLEDRSDHARRKAAVLSALAAFDSDDDERDDTYDIADVGGSIDAVAAGADADNKATVSGAQSAAQSDLELFKQYKRSPATFDRGAGTRRSAARAELRKVTGMTDEAIEGWAVMLGRDSKRSTKLEQTLLTESGVNRVADTTDGDDNKSDDRQNADAANSRGGNRDRTRVPMNAMLC
ncbi:Mitochondrial DNA replication protein yhm2 [Ascosphaera pollenicola]|nr:Mitochondrial DNA replication protein yhm2 [Ascosphaera pollenicola]